MMPEKFIRLFLFLVALASSSPLPAQYFYTPVNRLWNRDTVFPADGFVVKDRLQSPMFGITVGTIPGAMPIPVHLQIDGTVKSWARTGGYMVFDDPPTPPPYPPPTLVETWVETGQELFRPVYGTIHFGYYEPGSTFGCLWEKSVLVLENGMAVDGFIPYSAYSPNQAPKYPASFGLSGPGSSYVSLSGDGNYVVWDAVLASIGASGSDWYSKLQSQATPVGFTTPDNYKVVVSQDRARVYRYITNLGMYLPVMWKDRAGNSVTFKWERKTSGLPSGALEMICLTINNEQNKGAQIQWVVYPDNGVNEVDIVRVDFVNVNAPSMHVKGYPGTSGQLPPGLTAALTPNPSLGIGQIMVARPKTGGPILRPTQIKLAGNRADLTAWWTVGWAIPAQAAGTRSGTRQWTLTYDGVYKNLIASFTDHKNLTTTFAYAQNSTDYPFGATTADSNPQSYWANYPLKSLGLTAATTTGGGLSSSQTWSWSASTNKVVHTVSFSGASLRTETDYTTSKPKDKANSVWKKHETYDGSTLLASIENKETAESGLNATLTAILNQEHKKKDEPTYTLTTALATGTYGLRIAKKTVKDSANRLVQETVYEYAQPDWAGHNPGNLLTATTTSYDNNGSALTLKAIQKNEWSGANLIKTYMADQTGLKKLGVDYAYNSGGDPVSGIPFLQDGATEYGPTQTVAYNTTNKQPNQMKVTDGTATYTSNITAFDTNNLPTSATDQLGVTAIAVYDDRGRLASQVRAGVTATYTYPTELKIVTSAQAGSGTPLVSSLEYDRFGRLIKAENPDGSETEYTYQGRTTTVKTKRSGVLLATQTQTVDALGRLIEVAGPGGVTAYSYTTAGALPGTYKTTVSHTRGTNTRTVTETRNILGQTLGFIGPQAGTIHTYAYDGLGNLTSHAMATSQGTQTRLYAYDGLGRLTSRIEPETGTTTFSNFTVYGNPKTIKETLQGSSYRTRNMTYDKFGRLTSMSSGADSLTYAYSVSKPLLTVGTRVQASGTVVQDYAYSAYGQLSEEKTTGADSFIAKVQYEYDSWGDISRVTYPGAASNATGRYIHYQYNDKRQLLNIRHNATSGAVLAALTYDSLGRKQDIIFGSGAKNTYTYNPIDRISKWETKPQGAGTITNIFSYDAYGYLSGTGEWSIANDALGWITAATGHGIATTHGHDAFGNNTGHQATPTPSTMINWSFPSMVGNRIPALTSTGASSWWQYSDNGEAAWVGKAPGGGYIQLGWDGLGLLKTVADGSNAHNFTYTPSGMRIRDIRTGSSPHDKRYVYTVSGALMAVYESQSRRDIVYANGEAIVEIDQGNAVYELHNDHLGSPRYITSGATGQIAGSQAFGPYGEQISVSTSGYRPLTGYTGHLNEDKTGLIYMKGRYYSPLWHRFVSSDQGADPGSLNQYTYGGGSPFMAKDPTGLAWVRRAMWMGGELSVNGGASEATPGYWQYYWTWIDDGGPGAGGGIGPGQNSAYAQKSPSTSSTPNITDPLCDKLAQLGITNKNFEKMKADMVATIANQSLHMGVGSIPGSIHEYGHVFTGKKYHPSTPPTDPIFLINLNGKLVNTGLVNIFSNEYVYAFHTHPNLGGLKFAEPSKKLDFPNAANFIGMQHFLGWDGGFTHYGYNNGVKFSNQLSGQGWQTIDCSGRLK